MIVRVDIQQPLQALARLRDVVRLQIHIKQLDQNLEILRLAVGFIQICCTKLQNRLRTCFLRCQTLHLRDKLILPPVRQHPRQRAPATRPLSPHRHLSACRPHTAAQRYARWAPVGRPARNALAPHPRPLRRQPVAPRAEMPAPPGHSSQVFPRSPPAELDASNSPDPAAPRAPSKTARPHDAPRPRIAPRLSCIARWLHPDGSVFAAKMHNAQCALEVALLRFAETGCRSPAPSSRPSAQLACQTVDRNKSPRGPAGPPAHTDPPAPASLPHAAALRPTPLNMRRSRPRRDSSRESVSHGPDAC